MRKSGKTISRRDFVGGLSSLSLSSCMLGERPKKKFANETEDGFVADILATIKKSKIKNKSLSMLYPKGCLANVQATAKEFQEKTGVAILLKEASLNAVSSEMILENNINEDSFDIALPPSYSIPDLVEMGIIEELSKYVDKYEPSRFKELSLYSHGDFYKGLRYGYQTDGDTYLLFINKKWLNDPTYRKMYEDKFGKTLDVPVTWRELDTQIRFFHEPSLDRYGGSLFRNKDYMAWEFWTRLHGNGTYPVRDDMSSAINSDEAKSALHELIAISSQLEPDTRENGLFENFISYAKGNKYCNLGWGGTQKYLYGEQSKMRNNLIFSPTPGGRFNEEEYHVPFFNWGWNYVISSNSKEKELAYFFCLFASTPAISTISVREKDGYFDPFMKVHYQDHGIKAVYGDDFLKAHQLAMEQSIPDFYLKGHSYYFSTLKEGLYAADRGQMSVEKALNFVGEQWESITEKMGVDNQLEQWNYLKSSYPKKLQSVLAQ